jgi:hypothetical protein
MQRVRQSIGRKPLVGAGSLHVAGLLALVADTVADLGRAVAGQVTDLTACDFKLAKGFHFGDE